MLTSANPTNSRDDQGAGKRLSEFVCKAIRSCTNFAVLAVLFCAACRQEDPRRKETAAPTAEQRSDHSVPQYVDRAAELGVQHVHTDGSSGRYFIGETLASGVGLFDYDGDGRLDLYFPNGRMLPPGAPPAGSVVRAHAGHVLYRQREDGTFVDVTQTAGVAGTAFAVGCCVGDYDADGDLDLYVTQYGPNILYRNNGDGTFVDVAEQAGVGDPGLGVGAAFFDYDSDGDLDLYAANYCLMDFENDKPRWQNNVPRYRAPESFPAEPDRLFRNEGNGRFTDVSDEAGIHASPAGRGMGVIATDVNGDGRLDLFVANDASENFLFINQGDGTFQENALMTGVALDVNGDQQGCMGVDIADCDSDGRPDLMVTNYQKQANVLYRMKPTGYFVDEAQTAGVASDSLPWVGWGTRFFDCDNDGFLDVFIANGHLEDTIESFDQSSTYKQPNQLLRNTGGGKFQDISRQAGPGLRIISSSRGAAFGDLDNDGDIDIVVCNSREKPNVLINDSPPQNHWLGLTLRGKHDRFALNAQATVYVKGKAQCREVRSGASYASQNDLRLHFGLGSATQVDKVEIRWPDGQTQTLTDLPIDRYTTVEQAD